MSVCTAKQKTVRLKRPPHSHPHLKVGCVSCSMLGLLFDNVVTTVATVQRTMLCRRRATEQGLRQLSFALAPLPPFSFSHCSPLLGM